MYNAHMIRHVEYFRAGNGQKSSKALSGVGMGMGRVVPVQMWQIRIFV